jgi:hypothetical protein
VLRHSQDDYQRQQRVAHRQAINSAHNWFSRAVDEPWLGVFAAEGTERVAIRTTAVKSRISFPGLPPFPRETTPASF